ncbi:tail fiber domain-containing protein [Dyadobacter soli]|nr:tail fiber domain-containing protein [Dyadobacter soli]
MKKWYRMTGTFIIGLGIFSHVNAQTQYGMGAGMVGAGRAFFGTDAGKINGVTGINNSFIGHQAGANNTSAVECTFIGFQAGLSNSNGGGNTFVGASSGNMNVDGTNNVFLGIKAGQFSTSGDGNVFIGTAAGIVNSAGDGNVAVGFQAYQGFGSGNCAVGYRASFVGGGNNNTTLGNSAGYSNQGGIENVFLGYNSGYKSLGGLNSFVGAKSGYSNSDGHYNAFFGYEAGYSNTTGGRNTYLGYAAGGSPTLINATALGAEANVTASNSIVLGKKANVGIGYSAPSFQLHLSTDAAAKAGSPDWTVASDSRLKRNITDFTDGLDLLKQIRPVWFQYNGQAGIETADKKFVGIIAQEMQKIAPYTIGTFTHQDSVGNKTEYLDYDANAVTYVLINSVKEQQRVIEEKEARIAVLEKNQQDLLARLEVLEQNSLGSKTVPRKADQSIETPFLEQNVPNGFSQNTCIGYYVPDSAKAAAINIYNSKGVKIATRVITARGKGEMVFSAESLQSGILLYELMVDGRSVGGRKMLIE